MINSRKVITLFNSIPKLSYIFLVLTITYLFLCIHGLFSVENLNLPLGYSGDGLLAMTIAKTFLDNNFQLLSKVNPFLGAPFGSDISGYPITEEVIFISMSILAKYTNIYFAANFVLLLAHIFSGLSFLFASRFFKITNFIAIPFSLIYAFNHYLHLRGLGHLVLSFHWIIPLQLVALALIYKDDVFYKNLKYLTFVSFVSGLFNPYYSFMYAIFLLFAVFQSLILNKIKKIKFLILNLIIIFIVFLINHIDTFLTNDLIDNNLRNLAALEVFGLKIPELFLTASMHPIQIFSDFAYKNYFNVSYVKGELWSPYLGFFGIVGFVFIYIESIIKLIKKSVNGVSIYFWKINFLLLFSVIGGFNLMLGVLGIQFFRATNRYSIVIMTMCLIFLAIKLNKINFNFILNFLNTRKSQKKFLNYLFLFFFSFLIFIVGYGENYGKNFFPRVKDNGYENLLLDDKEAIKVIDQYSMTRKVFQYPIMVFPENPPIHKMIDYDHLRLYLNSNKDLYFSYGDYKKRITSEWYKSLINYDINHIIDEAQKNNFDMFVINKKGIVSEEGIKEEFLNYDLILDNESYLIYKIQPNYKKSSHHIFYGDGWSIDEGTHRWAVKSSSDLYLKLIANDQKILTMNITPVQDVNIKINIDKKYEIFKSVQSGKSNLITIPLDQLKNNHLNKISFSVDYNPIKLNENDDRHFTFSISDLQIK